MTDTFPISKETFNTVSEAVKKIVLETGAFLAQSSVSAVSQKEGHANFVTDMDILIQNRLVEALAPLLPDASFLLEEGGKEPVPSDLLWVIDPIDGTQNFICGCRQSAIAAALVYRKTALLGIVYNPFLEELFFAVKGKGAFLNDTPIHVSQRPFTNAILCAGTSPYYEELHAKTLKTLGALFPVCGDFRRFGSAALEICYTACGRCDGYFEYRLSPWDYAAASVILTEAGGEIAAIEYDGWDCTRRSGIAAGNPDILKELLPYLRG